MLTQFSKGKNFDFRQKVKKLLSEMLLNWFDTCRDRNTEKRSGNEREVVPRGLAVKNPKSLRRQGLSVTFSRANVLR